MVLKRPVIVALVCQLLALGALCLPFPDERGQHSSRVQLFQDWRAVSLRFDDGRVCDFNPDGRFNLLDMYAQVMSSPNGKYAAVVAGLIQPGDRLEPPVLPCWRLKTDLPCDEVVLVIDLKTCRILRTVKVLPGRYTFPNLEASFDGSDGLLAVRYDFTTDFYRAPDFTQRLTVPFTATVLGELPGGRLLALGQFSQCTRASYYVILANQGDQMVEIARQPVEEWGYRLVGDWKAPGGWQALYIDDQIFAVLYPAVNAKTGGDGPTVEAYRLSGGPPAAKELPPDARDIRVHLNRVGRLVCSWAVRDKSVTSPLTFPKAARRGYCEACRSAPRRATHRIDGRGNLIRLSDRQTCSFSHYVEKGNGQRYDFLPYFRDTYVWASPQGHYVALAGALNPEQNPEKPAEVDRPNYFRKGYDSVVAVIDLDECRISRFLNIPPGETEHLHPRFTPDDALLLAGRKVYAAPDFHEIDAVGGITLNHPCYLTPIDVVDSAGKGATSYGFIGSCGYSLLRREDSHYEVFPIPCDPFPSPPSRYALHLLYATHDVAAILVCDEQSELIGGAPSSVMVVNYRSNKDEASLELPHDARNIRVEPDQDGTLVCRYIRAGRQVVKRLFSEASKPAPEPQDADK